MRENEERLNLALNAAQMGTWDWWLARRALRFSPESKRIFGMPEADHDITPDLFLERLHSETASQ